MDFGEGGAYLRGRR